jgi:clan AA aspartic protease
VRGIVGDDWKPIVSIDVVGPDNSAEDVRALVDTGFNQYLTLQSATAQALNLPFIDSTVAILADGSKIEVEVRRAVVVWNGVRRPVAAYITEGHPSLGMPMFQNCRLVINAVPGGTVTIDELLP